MIAAGMVGPSDPTIGQLRFYIKYWENWNANSEVAFRELTQRPCTDEDLIESTGDEPIA